MQAISRLRGDAFADRMMRRISFNIASILGASVAPFIATWLTAGHDVAYVGIYLMVMAAISLVAQLAMRETGSSPLDAVGRHDDPLRPADSGVQ